jgi:hypothetical protein
MDPIQTPTTKPARRTMRRRLKWWECLQCGALAALISWLTLPSSGAGAQVFVGPTGGSNTRATIHVDNFASLTSVGPGTAVLVFDVFHVGLTHTWFANVSSLCVVSPDLAAAAFEEERRVRLALEHSVRRRLGLWIPIPAMDWVYRMDLGSPGLLNILQRLERSARLREFARGFPDTGQSRFAGIHVAGVLGEVCFWTALVLIPLGLCRTAGAIINPFREPLWRRRLRLGLCPQCAYEIDLRRQERCPECGHGLSGYPREAAATYGEAPPPAPPQS